MKLKIFKSASLFSSLPGLSSRVYFLKQGIETPRWVLIVYVASGVNVPDDERLEPTVICPECGIIECGVVYLKTFVILISMQTVNKWCYLIYLK